MATVKAHACRRTRVPAMCQNLGKSKAVAVIDLHTTNRELAERNGPEASAEMASKKGDVTHFNEEGARAMADLVLAQQPVADDKLSRHLKVPPATTARAALVPPQKGRFHVYLLMGQSNMVGRDTRSMEAQAEHPRILNLNADGQWVIARDPLHPQVGQIPCGVGPGMSFAEEMLKADPHITIGLVPCAVGGTPLKRWQKGADLYEQAIARAKLAGEAGAIKGVLWHQGESDSDTQQEAETYAMRLSQTIESLRQDLGSDVPVVVGQLGEFLQREKYPHAETVRRSISAMPEALPRIGYADSAGLGHKGDQLHFSAAAEREFGVRYAKAMQQLRR